MKSLASLNEGDIIMESEVFDKKGENQDISKINELKAEGGLHKYADPSRIVEEKDAWRKAAIKKHSVE